MPAVEMVQFAVTVPVTVNELVAVAPSASEETAPSAAARTAAQRARLCWICLRSCTGNAPLDSVMRLEASQTARQAFDTQKLQGKRGHRSPAEGVGKGLAHVSFGRRTALQFFCGAATSAGAGSRA